MFSALYGSMVMFDTHDNAHAYQVRCKRSGNMSLPIMVEEDGASLVSKYHADANLGRSVRGTIEVGVYAKPSPSTAFIEFPWVGPGLKLLT